MAKGLKGTFEHSVDAKGRVFLPAKFREEMGEELVVALFSPQCLYVYSEKDFTALTERLMSATSLGNNRQQAFLRKFLSKACDSAPDKQGRITLPPRLREQVGIEKEVTIIGVNNRVEIWSTQAWTEFDESFDEASYAETLAELSEFGL